MGWDHYTVQLVAQASVCRNCLRGLACNHSSALCSHFPALWAWTPHTIPTYSDHSPDAPCIVLHLPDHTAIGGFAERFGPRYLGKAEGVSLWRYNDKSVLENLHCSTLFEARIASPNRCVAEFVSYSWYIWLYTCLNNSKYMSLRMCVYDIIYILVYYVQYIYNSVYIYNIITHMWIF